MLARFLDEAREFALDVRYLWLMARAQRLLNMAVLNPFEAEREGLYKRATAIMQRAGWGPWEIVNAIADTEAEHQPA